MHAIMYNVKQSELPRHITAAFLSVNDVLVSYHPWACCYKPLPKRAIGHHLQWTTK